MTKQTEITLSSLYDCTDYKMRVLHNSHSGGVVFQIKKGYVLLDGITLTHTDALELASFLNSLLGKAAPKPAEPDNLAVLYTVPQHIYTRGMLLRTVDSKAEAEEVASDWKLHHPTATVRLVKLLANYVSVKPDYQWKDI
jgi:hypothetical protein